MKKEDELILLDRLKAGDQGAFKIIFERYFKLLFVLACAKLKSEQEAEDLVQELFIEFWEKKKFLFVRQSIKYYLFQSVRNRCLNRLDRNKVRKRHTDNYIVNQPAEYLPSGRMENKELQSQFERAIASIPPESAKVFVLMHVKELKRKEVARILGISENTVKTQSARALQYLRRLLINFKHG
ncbi:MAG: RNA polymerase sigma-70 factor [Bacteroidota bacterium]